MLGSAKKLSPPNSSRKKNVLTAHKEVANAMPATPNQRISSKFRPISKIKLRTPQ